MPVRVTGVLGSLAGSVLFGGFALRLDNQCMNDTHSPLAVDIAIARRMDAYEGIYARTEAALGSGDVARMLTVAEAWGRGRRAGQLLPVLPAVYGDTTGEGAKGELVELGYRLASALDLEARRRVTAGDRVMARRCWLAALEPLRTLRYCDYATMFVMGVQGRKYVARARTARIELAGVRLDDPAAARALLVQSQKLRAEYIKIFGESQLSEVNPAFESINRLQHRRPHSPLLSIR